METRQQTTTTVNAIKTVDMNALMHMEYVYENFGFMPKWLNINAY
jgi:hypothetical protein